MGLNTASEKSAKNKKAIKGLPIKNNLLTSFFKSSESAK